MAISALALAVVAPCTLFAVAPVALVLAVIAFRRRSGLYIAVAAGLGGVIGTILLVLMVQGGPALIARTLGTDEQARTTELWIDAMALIGHADSHQKVHGVPPQSLEDFGWGEVEPKIWGKDVRVDPWGRGYRIERRSIENIERLLIVSDGPDRKGGTDDDVLLIDLEKLEPIVEEP